MPPDAGGSADPIDVPGRGVHSVEIAGRILAALAEAGGPIMLRDLAQMAAVTPAQAHAYVVSLRRLGLVEQEGGRYALGPFALTLGIARLRTFNPLRMAATAIDDIVTRTGLMATVSVWGTHGPTVVQVQEPRDNLHVNIRPGIVYSIGGSATGRAFAAFLREDIVTPRVRAELDEGQDSQRIGNPISEAQLAREVKQIRRAGFATARGSPIPGINALAAPVFDYTGLVQFVLTEIGAAAGVDTSLESPQAAELLALTRDLSARLGHTQVGARGFAQWPSP